MIISGQRLRSQIENMFGSWPGLTFMAGNREFHLNTSSTKCKNIINWCFSSPHIKTNGLCFPKKKMMSFNMLKACISSNVIFIAPLINKITKNREWGGVVWLNRWWWYILCDGNFRHHVLCSCCLSVPLRIVQKFP